MMQTFQLCPYFLLFAPHLYSSTPFSSSVLCLLLLATDHCIMMVSYIDSVAAYCTMFVVAPSIFHSLLITHCAQHTATAG
mmetsp:Transcript_39160/g.100322  ORF Transcript_39160/g.100322 Transcript_39160/m.100322 type:complete len:80 (+) Transcript_39160:62-301(+)